MRYAEFEVCVLTAADVHVLERDERAVVVVFPLDA